MKDTRDRQDNALGHTGLCKIPKRDKGDQQDYGNRQDQPDMYYLTGSIGQIRVDNINRTYRIRKS
jgi:hypothetical protein